jgi:glycosyltransferase involved in cell wall biosynthesis
MKNIQSISVIIPTRNEDIKLAQSALNSVAWVDDILIADSSQTRAEMENVKRFARKNNARYIQREYKYSADFKNWAIPQAKEDWILLLDSDEIVTVKLKKYIQQLLTSDGIKKLDGFGIARKHFFFGIFLRYGGRYPLYNVRLFRKECRYEDRDVHAHIILDKEKLKNISPEDGDILHYSDRNFDQFFERFNRYSDCQANYIRKIFQSKRDIKIKRFFTNYNYFKAIMKDIWFFIPGAPLLRFLWMYVVQLGVLDGKHGLAIAMLYSFQDYVSKTKYYLLIGEKVIIRCKIQNILIHAISLIFGKKQLRINYKECLNLS